MIAVVKDGEFTGAVYSNLSMEIIGFHKDCDFALIKESVGDLDGFEFRKPKDDELHAGKIEARKVMYKSISDPLWMEYQYDKSKGLSSAEDKHAEWIKAVEDIKLSTPKPQ